MGSVVCYKCPHEEKLVGCSEEGTVVALIECPDYAEGDSMALNS